MIADPMMMLIVKYVGTASAATAAAVYGTLAQTDGVTGWPLGVTGFAGILVLIWRLVSDYSARVEARVTYEATIKSLQEIIKTKEAEADRDRSEARVWEDIALEMWHSAAREGHLLPSPVEIRHKHLHPTLIEPSAPQD